MSMPAVPSSFETIEEWIVCQLYEQPKANHTTHTLFQQLERLLQAEPSRRDTINQLRVAIGQTPLSAEERVEEPKLEYSAVQYAVETLIQDGWAKGDRNGGVDGVYLNDLKLTTKGEAQAIRQKRKRAERDAVPVLLDVVEKIRRREA